MSVQRSLLRESQGSGHSSHICSGYSWVPEPWHQVDRGAWAESWAQHPSPASATIYFTRALWCPPRHPLRASMFISEGLGWSRWHASMALAGGAQPCPVTGRRTAVLSPEVGLTGYVSSIHGSGNGGPGRNCWYRCWWQTLEVMGTTGAMAPARPWESRGVAACTRTLEGCGPGGCELPWPERSGRLLTSSGLCPRIPAASCSVPWHWAGLSVCP